MSDWQPMCAPKIKPARLCPTGVGASDDARADGRTCVVYTAGVITHWRFGTNAMRDGLLCLFGRKADSSNADVGDILSAG